MRAADAGSVGPLVEVPVLISLVSTKYAGEKPQLADDQLMEVTKTIVGRL